MTNSEYVLVPREKLELAIKMIDRNMHHQWEKVADAASILRNVLSDAPASPVSPSHPRDEVVEALHLDDEELRTIEICFQNEQPGRVTPFEIRELVRVYRLALSKLEPSHG